MGRPPLLIGTHGKIKVYRVGPKKFRARTRYRDVDGKVYPVERYGSSHATAERRLKEAIRDWVAPGGGSEVTGDTRFRDAARLWLKQLESEAEQGYRSWGTIDTYRHRLETIVLPAVGELRMCETSPAVYETLCRKVRDQSSASSARTVRSVLSGVCGLAVRHGALDSNPVRDVGRLESKRAKNKPKKSRALSGDEVFDLLGKLDADEQACAADLPDLVRFCLGTGERTGEALGVCWPDFDEHRKLIRMSGNIIRAKGRGKIRNAGKTENSDRPIPLPGWCVTMLVDRRAKLAAACGVAPSELAGLIFASSAGTPREASNVRNRAWNPFRERAGYPWVTFRTFRKTVATLLDEAGLTARQIADILGHARPSMTQDVYMGRAISWAGAEALHAVLGTRQDEPG